MEDIAAARAGIGHVLSVAPGGRFRPIWDEKIFCKFLLHSVIKKP